MNFKNIVVLLTAVFAMTACDTPTEEASKTYFSAQQMATAASLRDAALAGNETWGLLEELVAVAPKRLAGSPGDKMARDWAVEKLESLGFDRVWVQAFQLRGWARVSATATVPSHENIDLNITSLGKSVSTPAGGVTADVVHFGTFEDLEAAAKSEVEGKIVFISNRMERKMDGSGYGPANIARARGHEIVARKGGVALLIRSIGTDNHDAPHTGCPSS